MTVLASRPAPSVTPTRGPLNFLSVAGERSAYFSGAESIHAAPVHCGTPMSIRPTMGAGYGVVAALTVVEAMDDASTQRTWACACGFLLDDWMVVPEDTDEFPEDQAIVDDHVDHVDHVDDRWMTGIRVAVGMVESAHWELDRADLALAEAIESGIAGGCAAGEVADAAGITEDDVTTYLRIARSGRSDL